MAATATAAVRVAPYSGVRAKSLTELGVVSVLTLAALCSQGRTRIAFLAGLTGFILPVLLKAYSGCSAYVLARERGSGRAFAAIASLRATWRHLTGFGWMDWAFPILACYAAFGIGLLAHCFGTLHRDVYYEPFEKLVFAKCMYVFSAIVQWIVLRYFVFPKLRELIPEGDAPVMWTAGFFALCHLPNLPLMMLCFSFGILGLRRCGRYGSILPIGLAHAILGICLSWCMPQKYVCLHVGQGYLRHAHEYYVDPVYGNHRPANRHGWKPQPTPSWLR